MKRLPLIFGLLCLLLASCGSASEDLAATMAVETIEAKIAAYTPTSTVTATTTTTFTPTTTITPTSTVTFTPLPPTATLTPEPIAALAGEEIVIAYSGPGKVYYKVAELEPGEELYFTVRSEDGEWLAFTLPNSDRAWVSIEDLDMNFDVYQLEAFDPPPTPVRTNKLIVVNNTTEAFYVSVPEGGVSYTEILKNQSLVFILPVQDYSVFISRNRLPGGYSAFVSLTSDKTVILNPSNGTTVNIDIR
ncbi:MAG: hypothetical protein JXB38_09775 [Anaerolineales bacterium]|nr:hypothetical protein [Anaerolineales bacterium]